MSGRYCHGCSQVVAVDANHKCSGYPVSDPVPVELTQADSYTADLEKIRKDLSPAEVAEPLNKPAPNELLPGDESVIHPKHSRWITGHGPEGYTRKSAVEGVVLPPIGDTSVQSGFEHGRYLTFVDMPHGQLSKMAARRERQLSEAIAQRDAARELAVTHKATYDVNLETLKRNHEIERRDWQQDMCDCKAKAEAALATERARVLQEALNVVRYTPQDGSTEVNQAVGYIESGILALIQK